MNGQRCSPYMMPAAGQCASVRPSQPETPAFGRPTDECIKASSRLMYARVSPKMSDRPLWGGSLRDIRWNALVQSPVCRRATCTSPLSS